MLFKFCTMKICSVFASVACSLYKHFMQSSYPFLFASSYNAYIMFCYWVHSFNLRCTVHVLSFIGYCFVCMQWDMNIFALNSSMAQSAMTVEREWVIYLFNKLKLKVDKQCSSKADNDLFKTSSQTHVQVIRKLSFKYRKIRTSTLLTNKSLTS